MPNILTRLFSRSRRGDLPERDVCVRVPDAAMAPERVEQVRSRMAGRQLTLRATSTGQSGDGDILLLDRNPIEVASLNDLLREVRIRAATEKIAPWVPHPDSPVPARCVTCARALIDEDLARPVRSIELMLTFDRTRTRVDSDGETREVLHMEGPPPRSFCSMSHLLALLEQMPDEAHLMMAMSASPGAFLAS